MATLLTIGEFSRMTHLSVKALRHYDDLGLLTPADVDPASGYRRYAVAQVPTAQVIRRFRDLDMPLDQIRSVLTAPDTSARDRVILDHLRAMEAKLDQTQTTVASLRTLLEGGTNRAVTRRHYPPEPVLAVAEQVAWDAVESWLDDAIAALHAAIDDDSRRTAASALYSADFFENHFGEVIAFVPAVPNSAAATHGRVRAVTLAGATYAVMVHEGTFASLDTTYAALGAHVTERAIGAAGPIRENYVVPWWTSDDESALRTEVCWPISAGD